MGRVLSSKCITYLRILVREKFIAYKRSYSPLEGAYVINPNPPIGHSVLCNQKTREKQEKYN
jgi:hypothetical protein